MSTVKLKRLKINQYRNVRPGTELRFDDGVNLVLGQNGSGKTTLLNLISAIVSHDLSSLQDASFNFEYELHSDQCHATVQIESHPRHDPSSEDDAAEGGHESLSDSPTNYAYHIRLSIGPTQVFVITGKPGNITVQPPDGPSSEGQSVSPFVPGFMLDAIYEGDDDLSSTLHRALSTFYAGPVPRFDESLDCFLAMTGRAPAVSGIGSPSVTGIRLRQRIPKGDAFITRRRFAPHFLAQTLLDAHRGPGGELRLDAASRAPVPDSSDTTFLRDTALTMGMSAAALKPEIRSTSETLHDRTFEIQGFSFTFTRPGNITVNHDLLSYGQKRLLAFFYYISATSAYLIADELVNGLHHSWIKACMDAIGERQAFLTSQNPLLFEYVEFDSIEQVQARFITCKSELVDGAEQLVWQNMPRDDAERFYRGYEADIEGIGDILINRGLW